jgi:NTP pyrophosphatase (non-canonical NTP hydrolase)
MSEYRAKSVAEREAAVESFSRGMLAKLADPKCAGRTEWDQGDLRWFLSKLEEEHQELIAGVVSQDLENIAEEAIDVANVALMVFDTAVSRLIESASDGDTLRSSPVLPNRLCQQHTNSEPSEAPLSAAN